MRKKCLLVAGCMISAGCGLTDVGAPDVIQPPQLASPGGANALRVGAISFFYGFVLLSVTGIPGASGLASDELTAGNAGGVDAGMDARRLIGDPDVPYSSMHQSRVTFLQAIEAFQKFSLPAAHIGQMFAFIGFDETYFGEVFCSGVPLSNFANGTPAYGQPLTTQQMTEQALADFDSAVVYSADSAGILSLAQVGRGRALLDLGRFDEAAAAVQSVPTDFVWNTEGADFNLQGNSIGLNMQFGLFYGVTDKKGVNGLDYVSSGDPRIQVQLVGQAADGTPIYLYVPYTNGSDPVVVASGVEARLIEAEVQLKNGLVPEWLATLNDLRTRVAGLAPLADPGTPDARIDLMFRERAFWLFFTGHRLGDLRRLVRQYGRPQEQVFPVGPYKSSGNFGSDVNLSIPSGENPNPNFHGCLDRNA